MLLKASSQIHSKRDEPQNSRWRPHLGDHFAALSPDEEKYNSKCKQDGRPKSNRHEEERIFGWHPDFIWGSILAECLNSLAD
jgi:hypothetical protein